MWFYHKPRSMHATRNLGARIMQKHWTLESAMQQHDEWYAAALQRRLAIDLLRANRDERIAAALAKRHEQVKGVGFAEKSRIIKETLSFIDNEYILFDNEVNKLPEMPSFT
jgi:hypothetical protein